MIYVNLMNGSAAKVIEALRQSGVEAYFRPTSDLATGPEEKKFSGNAQRRGQALYFASWHDPLSILICRLSAVI